ncbi:MAG: hypothetical protein NXI31_10745 [bacterium]|nr:hypothetical protein [bacterium]
MAARKSRDSLIADLADAARPELRLDSLDDDRWNAWRRNTLQVFAAYCGLRHAECRRLRWRDLELGDHPSVQVGKDAVSLAAALALRLLQQQGEAARRAGGSVGSDTPVFEGLFDDGKGAA